MDLIKLFLVYVKINIIQLIMKQQKQLTKHTRQKSTGLPVIENNGFNQTIIINNPNFNINYIDHTMYNPKSNKQNNQNGQNNNKNIMQQSNIDNKNSSKGIDAWNLNKNLKQFSETRQLGFFKGDPSKTKSNIDLQNSPYLTNKTKTQDIIKPLKKIFPTGTGNVGPISFRENRTLSTINHEPFAFSARQNKIRQNVTIDINDQSKTSFRKRKFEGRTKNFKFTGQNDSNTTIFQPYLKLAAQVAQTVPINGPKIEKKKVPANLSIRRNKFSQIQTLTVIDISNRKQQVLKQMQDPLSDMQNSLIEQDHSPTRKKVKSSNQAPRIQQYNRKRFEKSIQKISKSFLTKTDTYLNISRNPEMPSSKIQSYTATVQEPSNSSFNIDYKSSPIDFYPNGYDFQFQDQKPKQRPKTPYKRKKLYQQFN